MFVLVRPCYTKRGSTTCGIHSSSSIRLSFSFRPTNLAGEHRWRTNDPGAFTFQDRYDSVDYEMILRTRARFRERGPHCQVEPLPRARRSTITTIESRRLIDIGGTAGTAK
ncbi:unnamed protein product, partial [Nesidiocoris tenuis]